MAIRIKLMTVIIVMAYWGIQAYTGGILREYWTGINGNSVSDLTGNVNYPDSPTGRSFENSFEAPINPSSTTFI